MNENARKWVAALRSGEYQQSGGYLRTKDGFCCLGVACDIYMDSNDGNEWEKNGSGLPYYFFTGGGDMCKFALSSKVLDWLGLRNSTGEYYSSRTMDKSSQKFLTMANDDGNTFSEIADIIESEPNGLFR